MQRDVARAHRPHNSILDNRVFQSKSHKTLEPFLQQLGPLEATAGIVCWAFPS